MKKTIVMTAALLALSSPAHAFGIFGDFGSSQDLGEYIACSFNHDCGVPEYDDAHEWSWQYGSNVGKKSHEGYEFDGVSNYDFYTHVVQDLQSTITEGSVVADKPIVNFDGYGQTQHHVAGFKYEQYGYNYEHNPGGQDHHINNVDVQVVSKYDMNTAHGANYTVDGYDKVADATVTTRSTHVTWTPHGHDDWSVGKLGWVEEYTVQKTDHLIDSYEAVDYNFSFDIDAHAPKNIHQAEWDAYVFSNFDVIYSNGHQKEFSKEWVTLDNVHYRDVILWLQLTEINRDGQLSTEWHNFYTSNPQFHQHLNEDQKIFWQNGGGTGTNITFQGDAGDEKDLRNYLINASQLTNASVQPWGEAQGWSQEKIDGYASEIGIVRERGPVDVNAIHHATVYSDYHLLNDSVETGSIHVDYFGNNTDHDNILGVGSEIWADGKNDGRIKILATAAVISSINPQNSGISNAAIIVGTSDAGQLNISAAVQAAWGGQKVW